MPEELPYIFDLLWDIKEQSKLESSILSHLESVVSKLESVEDTGLVLSGSTILGIRIAVDKIKAYL